MKKITFKTLSILLAVVLLVVVLPIAVFAEDVSPCANLPCEHNYQVHYETNYSPISEDRHLKTIYTVQTCIWCEESEITNTEYISENHDFIAKHNETYVYASNEYHYFVVEDLNICMLCDGVFVVEQKQYEQWHEFDDSVDPEVDMEGVCIYCNERVSW